MSLILDALRKMEQDRKSRRGSALDLRPEVLRYRAASRPRPSRRYLPVAIGLVLLACGIGAGFFLKGNRAATVAEETAPAAPAAPAMPAASATPVAPLPPGAPRAPVAPVRPAGIAGAAPIASPVAEPRAVGATAGKAGSPAVRQPEGDADPARAEPGKPARLKTAHRDAVAASQPAPADITISGIAWQDERSLRRAVVNGALVGEGAEIAGARVVEIREDRVRLSRGGQLFDAVFSGGSR